MLLFRFSFRIQIVLLVFLAVPVSHAFAQRVDMSIGDEPGVIPDAADEQLPPQFRRQVVFYRSAEAPGTIIVQTAERFLYVVQPNGRAIRYGIGVGREGFQWQGLLHITRKQDFAFAPREGAEVERIRDELRAVLVHAGDARARQIEIAPPETRDETRHRRMIFAQTHDDILDRRDALAFHVAQRPTQHLRQIQHGSNIKAKPRKVKAGRLKNAT